MIWGCHYFRKHPFHNGAFFNLQGGRYFFFKCVITRVSAFHVNAINGWWICVSKTSAHWQSKLAIFSPNISIWKLPANLLKTPPQLEGHFVPKNLCHPTGDPASPQEMRVFPGSPKRAIPVGGVLPRLKELRDVTTWVDGSGLETSQQPTVKLTG